MGVPRRGEESVARSSGLGPWAMSLSGEIQPSGLMNVE